jgi:ABC-type sugar transport system ATPase subunit
VVVARIEFHAVARRFPLPGGGASAALDDASFQIESGAWVTLAGPSGCGKTTVLRLIAGLEEPDAGEIRINGRSMRGTPPHERGVAMMFQEAALHPHMSIRDNLAFGLQARKIPHGEIERRIASMTARLELGPWLNRFPEELSGGQKQRVALARALLRQPSILLLDEPLSNLDAPSRLTLRRELQRLHAGSGTTLVYVTHDQTEAMSLGEQIILMEIGKVRQNAKPLELYNHPADLFVARFFGTPPMNILTGELRGQGEGLSFHPDTIENPDEGTATLSSPPAVESPLFLHGLKSGGLKLPMQVSCGFRPEDAAVESTTEATTPSNHWRLPCRTSAIENLGREIWVHAQHKGQPIVVPASNTPLPEPGQTFQLLIPPAKTHWFQKGSVLTIDSYCQ